MDLKLRKQMQLELKRLQKQLGITFIYVTHDQEEAMTMSDRIAVMCAGEIQQIGTPSEIYNAPATRFVADFIGESNILPATAAAVRGDTCVYTTPMGCWARRLTCRRGRRCTSASGRRLSVCLRSRYPASAYRSR